MIIYDQNYLAHHGIMGMKWGVRRYQNPDGSLTPAGKKRYAKQIRNKEEAVRRLKNFKQYGEEDSVKSLKRYNDSTYDISKKNIQKRLKEEFGEIDVANKDYLETMIKSYGYDDPEEWARDELNYDRKRALEYSKEAKEYARRCEALINYYADKKVTDLTKEEEKSLKKLADAYYMNGDLANPYDKINIAYSKIIGK